jgi:uncharacterized protein (TIGR02231 family)
MVQSPRFLLTSLCVWYACSPLLAQPQQKLNIEQATVYLSGAELVSTARLNLQKGENEILFTNVAGDINSQSITVNATNGVVVESATFQNNYLATEVFSPKAKEIKDSIDLMTEARTGVSNKISAIAEQIAILQNNRKVSGDNTGLSVAELTKMLDLISTRWESLLNQKTKQEETLKKTDERIAKLRKQLDEEQKKDYQPGGQLLVKFYAKDATATAVVINYVSPRAGWEPIYDVFADEVNHPVKLYYKANIYQNSGVNWTNVRLGLSTGNPTEGVQAPVMNPWYLSFYMPQQVEYNTKLLQAMSPGAYQQKRGEDMALGGARSAGTQYVIDGVQVQGQSSMNNYVSVDNSGVNTTFDIDLPYSIPTDGKQHLVAVKKYELPATYRYYAVPKLDKDAFLQAQITNWEDLNLLPGKSNIFYEGAYVGQGMMDMRNVKDTMTISLGRDKKVIVKRERDIKLRSVKTIGTNVRETYAYNIQVRNTRKEPITLIVQDQQPVSNDKDIVIEDKETGGAEYDELTGMMKWNMQLAANETKKVSFGFTIKYPKVKTISNMNK